MHTSHRKVQSPELRPVVARKTPTHRAEAQPRSRPPHRSLRYGARSAGIYLAFSLLVSLLTLTLLETARTAGDWPYLRELITAQAGVVAMAFLVVLLIVVLVLAVTGRMWVTATLVLGTATLLGLASHIKYVARREPVYPGDVFFLREPRFLLDMVERRTLWLALAGLLVLMASSWGLSKVFTIWLRRRPRVPAGRRWRPTVIASRVVVAGLSLLLLSSVLDFNHTGNPWRRAFESSGAYWRKASQPANYRTNGFVGGFLYNLDTPAMLRPPGYTRPAMDRIIARYTAAADQQNASRSPTALEDVNVVMVLSESLSDPTRLEGMRLSEDPLPLTRDLMAQLPHGVMLSQKIGAGTSSMEFEALTGMSLSQFSVTMDTPYQMLVPDYRTFPSAVEMFNQMGHTTLAIHPFRGTLYQRFQAYPVLGFSDFVERSEMEYRAKLEQNRYGAYVSDHAAFREVRDAIDIHDEPLFVNLVTMQNHTPYTDRYLDPIEVEGLDEDDAELIGQYARGLTYTDRAIAHFLRVLDRSDEKTIVVLYGDHLPAGVPEKLYETNSERALHETPFFLYANFGRTKAEELPTTSPIFFLPRAFEMAGAPLPPYYALLLELERHVSAMEHGTMIGPLNRRVSREALSPEARAVLRDYRLVQYDLSIGRRYAEQMLYPGAADTAAASGSAD